VIVEDGSSHVLGAHSHPQARYYHGDAGCSRPLLRCGCRLHTVGTPCSYGRAPWRCRCVSPISAKTGRKELPIAADWNLACHGSARAKRGDGGIPGGDPAPRGHPVGMRVSFRATLSERDGRRLVFRSRPTTSWSVSVRARTSASSSTWAGSWIALPSRGADNSRSRSQLRSSWQVILARDALIIVVSGHGPSETVFGGSAVGRGLRGLHGPPARHRRPGRGRRPRTP
jgi:hypothetical protein